MRRIIREVWTHLKCYYYYFFFCYTYIDLSNNSIILILGASVATSETGASSIPRPGLEAKKSVTFDDGVKPGVETTASSAAAVAATNIMSSHKIRSNETDTDQVSLFKAGLIWNTLTNM